MFYNQIVLISTQPCDYIKIAEPYIFKQQTLQFVKYSQKMKREML